MAMLAFPKQLRGNRIPAPHQVESIDAHKTVPNVEQKIEEETIPQLKGLLHYQCVYFIFLFGIFVFFAQFSHRSKYCLN